VTTFGRALTWDGKQNDGISLPSPSASSCARLSPLHPEAVRPRGTRNYREKIFERAQNMAGSERTVLGGKSLGRFHYVARVTLNSAIVPSTALAERKAHETRHQVANRTRAWTCLAAAQRQRPGFQRSPFPADLENRGPWIRTLLNRDPLQSRELYLPAGQSKPRVQDDSDRLALRSADPELQTSLNSRRQSLPGRTAERPS
jgi:hypothetical protein